MIRIDNSIWIKCDCCGGERISCNLTSLQNAGWKIGTHTQFCPECNGYKATPSKKEQLRQTAIAACKKHRREPQQMTFFDSAVSNAFAEQTVAPAGSVRR
jgi:hypothetical protein